MALSSVELWQRISAAGLAAPMICRSWAAEALQELQPSDAADAEKILAELVRLGRLTDYQADLIAGRQKGDFKRGAWTLLRPVADPACRDWFEATKSVNDRPTWVRWLSSEQLSGLRDAAPSLPRGLRSAQIKGPHLQGVLVPELIEKQLQLQVEPLRGAPLVAALQQTPGLRTEAARLVRQVAEGLRPLHAAGLAHGRVMPDRIYWDNEAGATLARDPLCAVTAPLDGKVHGAVGNGLLKMLPTQFVAPEFLAPGQAATPASDIYSLGCVWWWLVTGNPLVSGSMADEHLAKQAQVTLGLPKDCDLPPPLVRCLQHCLGKNLAARFPSAEELCRALDAALAAVARGPVPRKAAPAKADSVKADSVKAEPTKAAPAKAASEPATKREPAKPVAAQPVTAQPVAAQSVAAQPSSPQSIPAQPAAVPAPVVEAKATVAKPADAKPVEAKPVAAKLVEAKPVEAKPVAAAAALEPKRTATAPAPAAGQLSPSKPQPTAPQPAPTQRPAPSSPAPVHPVVQEPKLTEPTRVAAVTKPAEAKPAEVKPAEVKLAEKPQTVQQPAAAEEADAPEFVVPQIAHKTTVGNKRGTPVRKKTKRKPANKWLMPVVGGLICLCLIFGILAASGALRPSTAKPRPKPSDVAELPTAGDSGMGGGAETANASATKALPADPRLDVYRIVDSDKNLLWVPPAVPKPISLDLLPPGAQAFITLRPSQLLGNPAGKSLLAAFNDDIGSRLDEVARRAGLPMETIDRVTIAVYAENETLRTCLRVKLATAQTLTALKNAWAMPADEKVKELTLLTNKSGESYFVAEQPLVDSQSVSEFAVGPTGLMREAVEMNGAAGPLVPQLEKLWQASDSDADFSLLLSTPFLFSDGKAVLASSPKRLASQLREALEKDWRGLLLQSRLVPSWYVELQVAGTSDREAPRLAEALRERLGKSATAVEEWFVSEQPHPYWRSLAIRYPQMLRALAEQSRTGIDNGAAVANAYLPTEAASNILLATWIAAQDGATLAADMPTETTAAAPTTKPLSIEEYLNRPIKLSFDQEPIESALRLVGEEANANLPPGTPALRFALDGGAFERAGITRNQQLRDFKHVDLPMRDALTSIAKRGNPVTTVKDTREEDQRLIWVVRDDPEQPGKQMISLTTRTEATSKNIALPIEFAPAK